MLIYDRDNLDMSETFASLYKNVLRLLLIPCIGQINRYVS